MPRYFLHLPDQSQPLPWDPHAGPRHEREADTRYFGRVFAEMEAGLLDHDIDMYLSWDVKQLPSYGNQVVAVVLGDEVGRIPRYLDKVRAVFKCFGTHPVLGTGPLRDPSATGLVEFAQYGVRWIKWLPGGFEHARRVIGRRLSHNLPVPTVGTIPVGTGNQLDLSLLPMADRPNDLFFAGSVEHDASASNPFGTPKARRRREMLAAVEDLRTRRPELRSDLRLTRGFDASLAMSAATYSHALMDSRICLAPRGTATETWRIFEGLRYGCLVVADRLPNRWFLSGAPILQLDRWNELEVLIGPLLADPPTLDAWQARTLDWWNQRCSEAAVGRYIAEHLNARSGAVADTPEPASHAA